MKILKRGAVVAAMAAASVAFMAGSASATISPNPYSTSSGTGSFTSTSLLGDSACDLSDVTGSSNATSGRIDSFTVSNCQGVIVDASYTLGGITFSVNLGPPSVVTVNVNILITNAFGGECLYTGTMTGNPTGTNTINVSGTMRLAVGGNLNGGICSSTASAGMTVTFPGATIS